jgi:hypothetical protein
MISGRRVFRVDLDGAWTVVGHARLPSTLVETRP